MAILIIMPFFCPVASTFINQTTTNNNYDMPIVGIAN